MADVTVRFQCGCITIVDVDKHANPTCLLHGARPRGVVNAPPPRFVGCVQGPHAVTQRLDPIPVSVAEKPMALKAVD